MTFIVKVFLYGIICHLICIGTIPIKRKQKDTENLGMVKKIGKFRVIKVLKNRRVRKVRMNKWGRDSLLSIGRKTLIAVQQLWSYGRKRQ